MQTVDCYSKNVQLDRKYETDEDELIPTLIKGKQALKAVRVLQLYEAQQVSGECSVLWELGQLDVRLASGYLSGGGREGLI